MAVVTDLSDAPTARYDDIAIPSVDPEAERLVSYLKAVREVRDGPLFICVSHIRARVVGHCRLLSTFQQPSGRPGHLYRRPSIPLFAHVRMLCVGKDSVWCCLSWTAGRQQVP